jgi:hypothetical protein
MIITLSRDDLAAAIARRLNLPPHLPSEWPHEIIDKIMRDMDRAAHDVMADRCRRLMTK